MTNFFQTVGDMVGMAIHSGPDRALAAMLASREREIPVLAVYVVSQIRAKGFGQMAGLLETAIIGAGGGLRSDTVDRILEKGYVPDSVISNIARKGGVVGASWAVELHRTIDDDIHMERKCDFRRRLAGNGYGISFDLTTGGTRRPVAAMEAA